MVGVLGESGSGKSTLAAALLRLLPHGTEISGSIFWKNQDLLSLPCAELGSIRGARIALIHQDPGLALSPVMRVGQQIAEVLRAHCKLGRAERRERVIGMLQAVDLRNPERVYRAYPHELSGGELHRVVIAQALVCRPELLIADECTRALDVATQIEILRMLREFNQTTGMAILFITHNPVELAGLADRVVVIYGGRIVEEGALAQVFSRPLHPYSQGLLSLMPRSFRAAGPDRSSLALIPDLTANSGGRGCVFEPRCSQRSAICAHEQPAEVAAEPGRKVSCFQYGN